METMIQTASELTIDELKTAYINISKKIAELPDHYMLIAESMLDALMLKLTETEFCSFCKFCDKEIDGI